MYETTYHRAKSVSDAASKLGAADDGKYISGGQTLLPTMKARLAAPSDLVDLTTIEGMSGIAVDGSTVTIGAATTHAEVAASAEVASAIPALAALASHIGDPAVRNRGTIGGSIANNDPAADYPEDEIVMGVKFPKASQAGYEKFPNPASRYAMVGVFAAKAADGVRVAVTGAGNDGVFRHGAMEAALSNWSADALEGVATSAGDMLSDIHGSAEYRAHLVGVIAKRAVAKA